ncbi:MAG: peptide chain release factor N(5)-glutamine methyltransferase [Nitrospirae bacterium]|nr:peptide chain release factor N(5)-glutamine methyltransferase [Nitrospirota bacterium]
MIKTKEILKHYGIEDAVREAEIIICYCLGIDRAVLYRDNPVINKNQDKKINNFLKRRSKREPLQYIIGYVDFYGLKIEVGKGVLIPRPETELLVEEAIKAVKREALNIVRILDLCTGSGCLALALAKEFPSSKVYGTDLSKVAIQYAKENARTNRIENVEFLEGSLYEPIKKMNAFIYPLFTFDLIISNPPYIRRDDIKTLQSEIKDWEPAEALNGGEDGLDYYRIIIPEAKVYLNERGYLFLEIGENQSGKIIRIAERAGFKNISLIKDYAGVERIFIAKKEI